MKRVVRISLLLFFTLAFIPQAMAGYKVEALDAKAVQALLSNQTVTIIKGTSKKSTKTTDTTYKAFISNIGTMRTLNSSGESNVFNWSVGKNGYFCMKNAMLQTNKGKTCGYFLKEDTNTYGLYRLKGVKAKNGRVVYTTKKNLVLTIKGRVAGNKL